MNQPRPTDQEQAVAYARAADAMRSDARTFTAIATSVEPQDRYLTFSTALANRMRDAYAQLADVFREAAEQSDSIAIDYAAHADGSYEPLQAS